MKVLVVPEDFRHDQHILLPLVEKLLGAAGFPRARVKVCNDPLLGSVEQALNKAELQGVIDRYPMVDLFLLIVDRDAKEGRSQQLRRLESEVLLKQNQTLIGENAVEEVEVWLLAGHDLPSGWNWKEIRAHRDPKESFYEPFARRRGVWSGPGQGRRVLGREAVSRYDRIRQLCPEVAILESRVSTLGDY